MAIKAIEDVLNPYQIYGQSTPNSISSPTLLAGSNSLVKRFSDWGKENGLFSAIDTKTGVKTPGMLDYGIGAVSGLGNLWMGMKNYGLAKDQLAFQEDAYAKNYAAQKQTTNASLEDRQRARVAANPAAYVSVSDYMAKNGIA